MYIKFRLLLVPFHENVFLYFMVQKLKNVCAYGVCDCVLACVQVWTCVCHHICVFKGPRWGPVLILHLVWARVSCFAVVCARLAYL